MDATPGQGIISIRMTLDSMPYSAGRKAVITILLLSITAISLFHTGQWTARGEGAWTLPALLSLAIGLIFGAVALMLFCGMLVDSRKEAAMVVDGDLLIISDNSVERWRLPRADIQKVRLIQGSRSLHFDATRPAHRMIELAPCSTLDLVTEHGAIRPFDGWSAQTIDQAARELAGALSVPLEVVQKSAIAAGMNRATVTPLTITTKAWRILMLSLLVATGLWIAFISFDITEEMQHGPWVKVRGAVFSMRPPGDGQDLQIQYSYVVDGRRYHNHRLGIRNESDNVELMHLADTGRVGSAVDVYYNPLDPADSLLVPHGPLWLKVIMGMGSLCALAMCVVVWRGRPTLATDALIARYPQPVQVQVHHPPRASRSRKPNPPMWRLSLLTMLASILFGVVSYWMLLAPLRAGRLPVLKTEEDLAMLVVKVSSYGIIFSILPYVFQLLFAPFNRPLRKAIAELPAATERKN